VNPVESVPPLADGNRIEYRRDDLTEWYLNTPGGIEQGFTIERCSPANGGAAAGPDGPVVLEIAPRGSARPRLARDHSAVIFETPAGEGILRYGQLRAEDARGRTLEASLALTPAGRLRLEVVDDGAAYPLRIDPLLTSPSWQAEGNQGAAHMGIAVASAGDVNGDGFSDVVVSAPWYDANEITDQGRVFVYHGSAAGLSTTAAWISDGDQPSSYYGYSVASAGDVNKDGYADLIVGNDSYTGPLAGQGRARLFLGSSTGLRSIPAWTVVGDQANAGFGWSVASAGDVNKDGYSDVILSADLHDSTVADDGRVYVYLGSSSGLATTPAWFVDGGQSNDEFGWSVASAGDINKDGYGDVIVGAPDYGSPASDAGKVFVYLGSASGLPTTPSWTFANSQAGSFLGYSVASGGDVNRDGYGDVLVGAHYYKSQLNGEGRAYLFLGSSTGLETAPAWTHDGGVVGAHFGNVVASAGDVDADGYGDAIIGAFDFDTSTYIEEGRAFLFPGSASGLAIDPSWIADGNQTGAWFGWSTAPAGDVNQDGFSDIVIGAPVYANGQSGEGRVYLYIGSGPCVDRDGDGYGSPGGTGCRVGTVLDCNDTTAAIYPGAVEVCNDLDDNCDGKVDNNVALPAGSPAVTTSVVSGATKLSWSAVSGATAYDIVLGDVGTLRSTGGNFTQATQRCLANDLTAASFPDTHGANAGQALFFVVRAVNCGGAGTYDEGGSQFAPRDAGINASQGACP
jgi:hypothetical protein